MRRAIGPAGQIPSCSPERSSTGPLMRSTGISLSEFAGASANARSYGAKLLDGDAPLGPAICVRKGIGLPSSTQAGWRAPSAAPSPRFILEAGHRWLLGATAITALISG